MDFDPFWMDFDPFWMDPELIKLDLFAKLLIEADVGFKFVKEGSSTYLEIAPKEIPSRILTTISKLGYVLSNGRIKILWLKAK